VVLTAGRGVYTLTGAKRWRDLALRAADMRQRRAVTLHVTAHASEEQPYVGRTSTTRTSVAGQSVSPGDADMNGGSVFATRV